MMPYFPVVLLYHEKYVTPVDFNGTNCWQDAAFMQALNPGDPHGHAQFYSSSNTTQWSMSPAMQHRKAITGREPISMGTTATG